MASLSVIDYGVSLVLKHKQSSTRPLSLLKRMGLSRVQPLSVAEVEQFVDSLEMARHLTRGSLFIIAAISLCSIAWTTTASLLQGGLTLPIVLGVVVANLFLLLAFAVGVSAATLFDRAERLLVPMTEGNLGKVTELCAMNERAMSYVTRLNENNERRERHPRPLLKAEYMLLKSGMSASRRAFIPSLDQAHAKTQMDKLARHYDLYRSLGVSEPFRISERAYPA